MADHEIPTGQTLTSTLFITAGQTVLVNGSINTAYDEMSSETDGIYSSGDGNTIEVNGYVGTNSQNVTGYGMWLRSGNTITVANTATVYGPGIAIFFDDSPAHALNTISNAGTIKSDTDEAIFATGSLNVTNSGTIDGGTYGIRLNPNIDSAMTVTNSGTIKGDTAGIMGSKLQDVVVNTGSIEGGKALLLGDGDDKYDGRNGGTVVGDIELGQGSDTAWGGAGIDVIQGGQGADSIDGGGGNDILSGGEGADILAGGADNDTYYVDQADDQVIDVAGQGADTLYVVTSAYTLAQDAEIETIVAWAQLTSSVDITGNNFGNKIIGHDQANVLKGGGGNDTLEGWGGDDVLSGDAGVDLLKGGANNDTYYVKEGDTVVELANEGSDRVYVVGNAFVLGAGSHVEELAAWAEFTQNDINITGNELANKLMGHNGRNVLKGGGEADILEGGGGNDTLEGGTGSDQIDGGTGVNTAVFSGRESDYIVTRNGDGTITVQHNNNGQDGTDTLTHIRFARFEADNKTVALINSAPAAVSLSNATVAENAANAVVGQLSSTDADGDAVSYAIAADADGVFAIRDGQLVVTRALDFEAKTQHSVTVKAKDAWGGETTQTFTVSVTDLADTGTGGGGTPGAVNLVLRGTSGANVLTGQAGNDTLYGGLGKDVLTGAAGKDTFVFDTRPNSRTNVDTITDFVAADDSIQLDNKYLKKLGSGSASKPAKLKAAFFKVADKAKDANDYLVYDRKKGVLYYDEDGSGAKAAIAIAKLANKASLTKNDFFVI